MGLTTSTPKQTTSRPSPSTQPDSTSPERKIIEIDGIIEPVIKPKTIPKNKIPISIGVDLGTTFSSIGIMDPQTKRPKLITFSNNEVSIPSWIRLVPNIGNENEFLIYVGNVAQTAIEGPALYDSKRLINKSIKGIFCNNDFGFLEDDEISVAENKLNSYPFEICMVNINGDQFDIIENTTENDYDFDSDGIVVMKVTTPTMKGFEETFFPETVSALILKYMMKMVENEIGDQYVIDTAVISIPSEYSEKEKNIVKFIGNLCGISEIIVREESICALTSYLQLNDINDINQLPVGSKIVIIDFGGGTLDISGCERNDDGFEILFSGGDKLLGGNDFDDCLTELLKEIVEKFIQDNCEYTNHKGFYQLKRNTPNERREYMRRMERLKKEVIRIKHHLSDNNECQVNIKYLLGVQQDLYQEHIITREIFNEICEELFKRFEDKVFEIVSSANFTKESISKILLVGGSCKIPRIQEIIAELFGEEKILNDDRFNSMTAVCEGAIYSSMLQNENAIKSAIDPIEKVPENICLLSGGELRPMIKKGDKLPATGTIKVSTYTPGSNEVHFAIYKSPSKYADSPQSKRINELIIKDLPPTNSKRSIYVTLTMDKQQMLKFTARIDDVQTSLTLSTESEQLGFDKESIQNHFYALVDLINY